VGKTTGRTIRPEYFREQYRRVIDPWNFRFYFDRLVLQRIAADVASSLVPGGEVLLVHWTPLVDGHATTAETVHDTFIANEALLPRRSERAATYRADVLVRA